MIHLPSGEMNIEEEDFQLNAPIPLVWKRNYDSWMEREGLLGISWRSNYDQEVVLNRAENEFKWVKPNGSIVFFPYLEIGEDGFVRTERIEYQREKDKVFIKDINEELTYHFEFVGGDPNLYKLVKIAKHRFSIDFEYNQQGVLEFIVDAADRKIDLEKDEEQRIIGVSFQQKNGIRKTLVRYAYNEEGQLTNAYDGLDQPEKYTYADRNLLTLKTDRNGNNQFWEYEPVGEEAKCTARWFDNNQMLERFYYQDGQTIIEDAFGNRTTHFIDNDLITSTVDVKGNTECWEYNEDEEVIRYTDQLGNHTYYGYDDYGNQTSIRLPNGGTTSFIYEENKLVMAKNASDALWIWEYNKEGLLEQRIGPDNDVTKYNYDQYLLTKVTDANGRETTLTYNEENNLEKVTLPNGAEAEWSYNNLGQLTNAKDPNNASVNYGYDGLGRVTQIAAPDGNRTRLKYDAVGNVISAKDLQHKVDFKYSATGKLTARKENKTEVVFEYDKADQLAAIKNEQNSIYHFQRDAVGNITRESGFDGLLRKYDRNPKGEVSKVTTPDEKQTIYYYDKIGNLSKVVYYDDTQEVFTYNKDGLLVEAANAYGNVELKRDAVGRVLTETQGQIDVTSKYNRLGERINLSSSIGADIAITRDKDGDITQTEAAQGESKWEVQFKRDLVGLEIERNLPGGVKSSWQRDSTGKPLQHSVSVAEQTTRKKQYNWDVNDRLRSIKDLLTGCMVRFSHDLFGNLASAQYEDGSWDYKLPDAIGNLFRTKEQKDRTYGAAGQLLKDPDYTYSYDPLGNLIEKAGKKGSWFYHWTQNGMLEKVTKPDGKGVSFTYDALGRRLTKTFNGETTHFVWDGNVPLHEWTLPEDDPELIVNETGELTPNIPANLTTWVFEDGTFVPMAKLQNGESYSIITDHLGTPCEAYNNQGKKVWSAELDIYGKVRNFEGDRSFIPFRYQGQYEDAETGLYYNRFRYYSLDSGTYISQDPIGLAGSNLNFYAYVKDSCGWIDPFGLTCTKKFPSNADDIPDALPHLNMKRVDKSEGKVTFEFEHKGREYKLEYHPKHGGTEHFNGNHFHIKKKGVKTNPDGNSAVKWFRIKNTDPNTPAMGGTFAPGDLFPEEIL